jgi:putative ABC transport system permease protein
MSLRRYTYRAMQQRPGRSILTMLSIVIGVTAAVAVGLGTATTRNAYKQMFAMVTGRATLEVDASGGGGFDGDVLSKIDELPEIAAAAPLVDRPTSMSFEGGERRARIEILGIDPVRDSKVRDYDIAAGRQVKDGDELVLDESFAKYLGLEVGQEVKLLTKQLSKPFEIVGLVRPKTGTVMTQTAMAFMPIDRAQLHFNPRGKRNLIDKIQIVTASDADPVKVEPKVAAILPESVQVHRPAGSTQLMQETLLSTEQGLTLTTGFILAMAAFIILNTFLMNVSERRRHLSIMRAIGATRLDIARMLLREAIFLGGVGIVIGIGCGLLLAFIGTSVVGRVFDVQFPRLAEIITPWPFIWGTTFGIGMSLLGAIIPAIVAWYVSPLEGMNRAVAEKNWSLTWTLFIGGMVLTAGSLAIIYGSISGLIPVKSATYCGVVLLIGLVMLDTVFLAPQASLVSIPLRLLGTVESRMALTQVLRNYLRTALTVGVLFIAGAACVGMAGSIIDCVRNVHDWFDRAITGDFFIRAMMPDMATGTAADLPEELATDLRKLEDEGLIRADAASFVQAKVQKGKDADDLLNVIVIAREYKDPEPPSFDLISGDSAKLREQLLAGQVIIGSVLSQKLNLDRGDELPLETKDGVKNVPICAVANEYMVGGLAVHLARRYAEDWLGLHAVDGYIIRLPDYSKKEQVRVQLAEMVKKYDVILMSNADIKQKVNQFARGTEWSLWLLLLMGFVVGAFGVVNTLTMNVLEQTRELGLLRIVAMTKRQVRRTILMQALIIGGVGLPAGIVVGIGTAYVINLAMMKSFGHLVAFQFHPEMWLGTLVASMIIVVIAGIIPARRATNINVVEALHYE